MRPAFLPIAVMALGSMACGSSVTSTGSGGSGAGPSSVGGAGETGGSGGAGGGQPCADGEVLFSDMCLAERYVSLLVLQYDGSAGWAVGSTNAWTEQGSAATVVAKEGDCVVTDPTATMPAPGYVATAFDVGMVSFEAGGTVLQLPAFEQGQASTQFDEFNFALDPSPVGGQTVTASISGGADASATSATVETTPAVQVGVATPLIPGQSWTFPGDPAGPYALSISPVEPGLQLSCRAEAGTLVVPASLTAEFQGIAANQLFGFVGYEPASEEVDSGNGVTLRLSAVRQTTFMIPLVP